MQFRWAPVYTVAHLSKKIQMPKINLPEITESLLAETSTRQTIPGTCKRKASVFLLLKDSENPEILFIQKADNPGYPWRNQAAFPGGHIDPDETSLNAAFREISEELAIPASDVKFISSLGFYETINNTILEAFAGIWNGKSELSHDETEIARIVMVKVHDLMEIHESKSFTGRNPGLYELIYQVSGIEIWGVTARIVHRFLEIINRIPGPESFLKNAL